MTTSDEFAFWLALAQELMADIGNVVDAGWFPSATAKRTPRRFSPKLAISVHRKPEDLPQIPDYLCKSNIAYDFFLDQFTMQDVYTVLFARPRFL
jgi:hypothetical protein